MLIEKIKNDLKEAMRLAQADRLSVLRLLMSALHNRQIEKRGKSGAEVELTEEEVVEVAAKEAKKRKESIGLFRQGGRDDLAIKEEMELSILVAYLPAQISEAEIKKVVARCVTAAAKKEFGVVMKEVMKELKGKADAATVSQIVKEFLA